jgi:hypothetical protein
MEDMTITMDGSQSTPAPPRLISGVAHPNTSRSEPVTVLVPIRCLPLLSLRKASETHDWHGRGPMLAARLSQKTAQWDCPND